MTSDKSDKSDRVFDFRSVYESILPVLLEDQTRVFPGNLQAFNDTFFDRTSEVLQFRELLDSAPASGRNVIIVGNAGVGKTSFIYRLVSTNDVDGHKMSAILADYRTAVPKNMNGCLLGFIQSARHRFADLGVPVPSPADNTPENIPKNTRQIHEHLAKVGTIEGAPRIVIFLDDFDYAEDVWYQLLEYFLPFAQSPNCCVVLSMRPPLYAAIQAYDDRIAFYFGRNVSRIELNPLPAREVLAARLAPILVKLPKSGIFDTIITSFSRKSRVDRVRSGLKLTHIEDLREMDFPFTDKHNEFMQRITNGNLREIMNIALDSMVFILRKWSSLEVRREEGHDRRIIGRENTLRLFFDDPNANYQIMNINKLRSTAGNSLLYNVLEAVKVHPSIDDALFEMLASFGHKADKVKWAIAHLADKTQRLLEPRCILPPERKGVLHLYDEYEVTDKGNYYLDIARWAEYSSERRAGPYGRSVLEAHER